MDYFEYSTKETDYLKSVDSRLVEVIDRVGHLYMPLDPDMFTALVRNIIGQQISIPVYERIWADFQKEFGESLDCEKIILAGKERLRELGVTNRKSEYIMDLAHMVSEGKLDSEAIGSMSDEDAMAALDSIRGIGPWTAEMVLLFYMNRKDVFSYGDLALLRGMCRLYGHEKISPELFEEYRRRFTPYCSVAMLYIWEVGEGRVTLP